MDSLALGEMNELHRATWLISDSNILVDFFIDQLVLPPPQIEFHEGASELFPGDNWVTAVCIMPQITIQIYV